MKQKSILILFAVFTVSILSYYSFAQEFDERKYVSQDPSVCDTIRFDCEEGIYFSDESGCGCIQHKDNRGLGGAEGFDNGKFEGDFDDRFSGERGFEDDRFRGLSKDELVFEMVFEHLGDDIDEREIMSFCSEPEKIADIIMGKVKDKIGDVSNACDEAAEMEAGCMEEIEYHCSNFMQPDVDDTFDEIDRLERLAHSCPVNEQAIVDLCVFHSKEYMEQESDFLEQECEYEWEDYGQREDRNCELQLRDAQCDEDEFIGECLVRWGAYECKDVPYPDEDCNGYWDQEYNDEGCIVDYFCVEAEQQEDYDDDFGCSKIDIGQCGANENLELEYDAAGCVVGYNCMSSYVCGDGICDAGEEDSCIEDCRICDISEDDAERMINECLEHDGAPEKIFDGQCITDVKCTIDDTTNGITGNVVGVTGRQVLDDFDDFKEQCKKEWEYQDVYCEQLPSGCGKDNFIDSCIDRRKKDMERDSERSEQRCEADAKREIREMERQCSRMEQEKDRCYEEGKERCGQFSGISDTCREKLTEANLREYILKEAKSRCRFAEEYFKEAVYSNSKPKRVVEKILELKERGVPGEFTGILDEEAEQLLGVSDSLEELGQIEEEKGFGYKIKLFLGFAKEAEENEIASLERSRESLDKSIESLRAVSNQVDDTTKAVLEAQILDLERQQQDIEGLIEQKKKKSKGLLRLFGLLG